jgi:hypothetical protein
MGGPCGTYEEKDAYGLVARMRRNMRTDLATAS